MSHDVITTENNHYEGWITKQEAANKLGVSIRTIENMLAEGKLDRTEQPRARSRPVTMVRAAQVEAMLPHYRPVYPMPPAATSNAAALFAQGQQIIARPPDLTELLALLAAIRQEWGSQPEPPMNLTLDEAAELSRLPKRLLMRAIREGRLRAHRFGKQFYIARVDLNEFRPVSTYNQPAAEALRTRKPRSVRRLRPLARAAGGGFTQ